MSSNSVKSDLNVYNAQRQGGIRGDGINDDTAGLQAALSLCRANTLTCYLPPGNYKISDTLEVVDGCNLHMHPNATLLYGGSGVAVLVTGGRSGNINHISVEKAQGARWYDGVESSSVGIEIRNTLDVTFESCSATGFGIGVLLHGIGPDQNHGGVAHNLFSKLDCKENLVNLELRRSETEGVWGFANQNTFIGGRCRHGAPSGAATPSSPRTNIKNDGNNNTWVGFALEGSAFTEYSVHNFSPDNLWLNCRWELAAPIWHDNINGLLPGNALNNGIVGGNLFFGDDDSPGSVWQVEVIDTGAENFYMSSRSTKLWGSRGEGYGPGYALQLTSRDPTGVALEIRKSEVPNISSEGDLVMEFLREGRIGVVDSGGTMRYLQPPTGGGPAVWV